MTISRYYDKAALEAEVQAGRHREAVGGLWDEIGQLQVDFLISQGLMPHHRLLDIGCGSLRGGVKLIKYLDAGHYAGVDLHESLLNAGYDIELAEAGLRHKLPRSNLVVDGEFDFSWCPMRVDFALAQSVFTALPLNFCRICLEQLPNFVVRDGNFFVSTFEIPDHHQNSAVAVCPGATSISAPGVTRCLCGWFGSIRRAKTASGQVEATVHISRLLADGVARGGAGEKEERLGAGGRRSGEP